MSLKNTSNSELFRAFAEQGSQEAISLFFQNQADLFYRVAFKYAKNKADAEDIVQTSFLKIIEKANQYKGVRSNEEKLLQSWCLSIVIQIALMNNRTDSNRRKRESLTATKAKSFYEDENMDKNNDKKVVYRQIENAIVQLPEKYRIPIHLKYTEGFDLKTISEILNININTLKSDIKRGLEKVSAQLKEKKVTLSSVSLVELIGSMPIEKAPVTIQNMASNFLETSKNSRLVLTSAKTQSFSSIVKVIIWVLVLGITTVFLAFYANLFQSNKNYTALKKTEVAFSESNKSLSNDLATTYLKYKAYDTSIKFLIGKIEFSEKTNSAYEVNNLPVMISLPINPQTKITIVESLILPNSDNHNSNGLVYRGYWIKNQSFLKCDVMCGYQLKTI